MPRSEKDRLAAEFEERWIDFKLALSDERRYPLSSRLGDRLPTSTGSPPMS